MGDMLVIPRMNIRRKLCQQIAQRFDPQTDSFDFGGKPVQMQVEEVQHLMGLPAIGKEFIPIQRDDLAELYEELKDPEENKITLKWLVHLIKNSKGATFIRAFVMYSVGMILCPTTQRHVSAHYLGLVVDLPRIGSNNYALP